MNESDFKKLKGQSVYAHDAADGRLLALGHAAFTHVDVRRSMVSERIGWAWEVQDPVSDQAIVKKGFKTRRAAFEDLSGWIKGNPVGKRHGVS